MDKDNKKSQNNKKNLTNKTNDKMKTENKEKTDKFDGKSNFSKSNSKDDETFKEDDSFNNSLEIPNKTIKNEDQNNYSFDHPLSKILPVGLKNLGSSCFMNACVQCFFHCSSFIGELLQNHTKYEKIKGDITSAFLKVSKNLYTNGKFPRNENNKKDCASNKLKYYIDENFYYIYNETETNPTSADNLFSYIINNYSRAYHHGSDPKLVAELILSKMANEIGPEFKYIPSKDISKTDELPLFLDIYKFYNSIKHNIIVSNFYWIKEKQCICSECNKSTYNFQLNYIHYFYPEVILNKFTSGCNQKYNLSIEICFEYFKKSEQDIPSFACKVCNKRVKPKLVTNYMVTLPKYLVFCLFMDKNSLNPKNYRFDYGKGKDIELKDYFKDVEGIKKTCTLYKFQSGCYSTWNFIHSIAFSYHFDGSLYEFNDSYYRKVSNFNELYKENPYLLFYRRADVDI